MITQKSSGPVTNCSQPFRSQKEGNLMVKKEDPVASRKLVLSTATRKLVRTLSAILSVVLWFKTTVIPTGRQWTATDANPSPREGLPTQVSKTITKVGFVIVSKMNANKTDHWETVRRVLLKEFAQERAKHFFWQLLDSADSARRSSKRRIEHCLDNKKSLCYLRAFQGHSGGIPIGPEMMEYTFTPYSWKEYTFHKIFAEFFIYFGEWTNFGRRREWQSWTSSLLHTSGSTR